jgi:hypothetical protein
MQTRLNTHALLLQPKRNNFKQEVGYLSLCATTLRSSPPQGVSSELGVTLRLLWAISYPPTASLTLFHDLSVHTSRRSTGRPELPRRSNLFNGKKERSRSPIADADHVSQRFIIVTTQARLWTFPVPDVTRSYMHNPFPYHPLLLVLHALA